MENKFNYLIQTNILFFLNYNLYYKLSHAIRRESLYCVEYSFQYTMLYIPALNWIMKLVMAATFALLLWCDESDHKGKFYIVELSSVFSNVVLCVQWVYNDQIALRELFALYNKKLTYEDCSYNFFWLCKSLTLTTCFEGSNWIP